MLKKLLFIILCLHFLSPITQASNLTPEAAQIYKNHHKAIVQIRVISRGSKEKSALGSGFFFSQEGLIATNYHVISQAINYPDSFSVEYIMYDGTRGDLNIINVDPIHDLAILSAEQNTNIFLKLGSSNLKNGDKIFSFGNPYDLGLIIVEGLFNGMLKHSMYRKILFSGALNPGMSGGPAVLSNGSVFGVNVSSAGNDLSFFVPVEFLKKLQVETSKNSNKNPKPNWQEKIGQLIINNQGQFLNKIIKQPNWERDSIGVAQVPSNISDEFKCWSKKGDIKQLWVKDEYLSCSTEDSIFLSSTLYTGEIYYQYEWYQSQGFDPIRFYNIYEQYADNREFTFQNAYESDVASFVCKHKFVTIDEQDCKVGVCMRAYKDYDQLFDISFQITRKNLLSDGFVINGAMLGFTQTQSKAFLNKFFKEIKWQK